jgi:hypothetical protein
LTLTTADANDEIQLGLRYIGSESSVLGLSGRVGDALFDHTFSLVASAFLIKGVASPDLVLIALAPVEGIGWVEID